MRLLIFILSVAMTWMTTTKPAVAKPATVLLNTYEGSLVIKGGEKETSIPPKKDTLHTMLSQKGQVYVFSGNTRTFSQTYAYGQTRFYQPVPTGQMSAGPYLETLIQKYSNQYGVDPSLVRAVISNESDFNPNAVSSKGAQGLMQLMPGTATLMGVNNPFDPEQNIAGGVGYLRHCLDCCGHNVPLAVAAYNAGPGRVARSQGVPSIPETQAFVKNVMGAYTERPTLSHSQVKSTNIPKTAMATRPSIKDRIFPSSPRTAAPDAEAEKVASRPRAKVIVVRYPGAKLKHRAGLP